MYLDYRILNKRRLFYWLFSFTFLFLFVLGIIWVVTTVPPDSQFWRISGLFVFLIFLFGVTLFICILTLPYGRYLLSNQMGEVQLWKAFDDQGNPVYIYGRQVLLPISPRPMHQPQPVPLSIIEEEAPEEPVIDEIETRESHLLADAEDRSLIPFPN